LLPISHPSAFRKTIGTLTKDESRSSERLRERLLKLGVHVVVSARRIVLHLPTSTPDLDAWHHIALALGARTG
jgi:hypothetical protein